MPFAASIMDEEEKKKAGEKNGVNVSGVSTSFATGVPGQEAVSGAKPATGSGAKFANIQSYLDANKQQGNEMGQKIASDVETNASDATNKIQSFQSQAPKVEAYDPNEAISKATSLTDADKQRYNQAKAGYQGPQTVDQVAGFGDTQKAVSKAAGQVGQATNEAGQRELLKNTYKRPDYSGGQNALDQTIMQNSAGAKQGFENLAQKYSGLSSMFDTATKDVGAKVNDSIKAGLANQQAVSSGESKAWNDLVNPIQARADKFNQENPAYIDRILNDASDETLSDESLAALGLGEGQNLFDLNLQSYVTPDRTQAGLNNVANADERQKYAALASLFGDTSRNQLTQDGKSINPLTFNKSQFEKDLAGRQSGFDSAAAPIKSQIEAHNARMAAGITPGEYNAIVMSSSDPDVNAPAVWMAQRQAELAAMNAELNRIGESYSANRKVKKG